MLILPLCLLCGREVGFVFTEPLRGCSFPRPVSQTQPAPSHLVPDWSWWRDSTSCRRGAQGAASTSLLRDNTQRLCVPRPPGVRAGGRSQTTVRCHRASSGGGSRWQPPPQSPVPEGLPGDVVMSGMKALSVAAGAQGCGVRERFHSGPPVFRGCKLEPRCGLGRGEPERRRKGSSGDRC